MIFVFKAKDQEGNIKQGKIDAVNRESAIKVLQRSNLSPIYITKQKDFSKSLRDIQKTWEGATKKDLMILFRQFATLIEAKVPVVQSLKAIGEQSESKYLGKIIKEVADDVEDGMPISESMAKYPETFSAVSVNIIAAGEVSGNLQESIGHVADNIEKNYELTSKVKGALFYPAFVFSAALIIGFLVLTFVLPNLTKVIRDMGVETPWYTEALMATGDFMENYWWAILILIAGAIAGFAYYVNTESGKREWDEVQIRMPIFGKIFRYVYLSRFASNFSMLLTGGIPIVKALIVSGNVVGNSVYKGIILRAADEVKTGGSVSTVFGQSQQIPQIVTRMIKIGEETGQLDDSLNSVARFYEREADNMVKNISSLIEPILIVVLGIGVAIMVFGILLPIYSITDQL